MIQKIPPRGVTWGAFFPLQLEFLKKGSVLLYSSLWPSTYLVQGIFIRCKFLARAALEIILLVLDVFAWSFSISLNLLPHDLKYI